MDRRKHGGPLPSHSRSFAVPPNRNDIRSNDRKNGGRIQTMAEVVRMIQPIACQIEMLLPRLGLLRLVGERNGWILKLLVRIGRVEPAAF